jgi:CheY-like chemotaxis protein
MSRSGFYRITCTSSLPIESWRSRAAREHRPAVAFFDLAMPEMTGPEVAQRLREEFPAGELTLVAVTRFGHNDQAASGSLFDHHLLKPVTADRAAEFLNSLT